MKNLLFCSFALAACVMLCFVVSPQTASATDGIFLQQAGCAQKVLVQQVPVVKQQVIKQRVVVQQVPIIKQRVVVQQVPVVQQQKILVQQHPLVRQQKVLVSPNLGHSFLQSRSAITRERSVSRSVTRTPLFRFGR